MNKILIVDDEVKIIKGLSRVLLFEGYEVIPTTDPLVALELIEDGGVGLVISDYRMPEMNGLELAAAIREKSLEVPIFLLTGYADKSLVLRAKKKGMITAVITKPWSEVRLLIKIKQCFLNIPKDETCENEHSSQNEPQCIETFKTSSPTKLLILEDDRMTQLMYEEWLSRNEFDIKMSASGKEGFELYCSWKPDIMLIDIGLQDLSGYSVLQMIREEQHDSDTQVIMATARSSLDDIQACSRFGIHGYMVKPFSKRQICGEILHCVNEIKRRQS